MFTLKSLDRNLKRKSCLKNVSITNPFWMILIMNNIFCLSTHIYLIGQISENVYIINPFWMILIMNNIFCLSTSHICIIGQISNNVYIINPFWMILIMKNFCQVDFLLNYKESQHSSYNFTIF